jgi:hypothetical protein
VIKNKAFKNEKSTPQKMESESAEDINSYIPLRYRSLATNQRFLEFNHPYFGKFEEHIKKNLEERIPECGSKYLWGEDRKLLKECRAHAGAFSNQREKNLDATVMLVHPFYAHLSHPDKVSGEDALSEMNDYLDELIDFVEQSQELGAKVVLFDTIHHYAASTSSLLEEGFVDSVFFTEYDSGMPIEDRGLYEYRKDSVFFAGGYNGKCLSTAIFVMESFSESLDLWGVRELMLNSPQDCVGSLKVKEVKYLDGKRIISKEESLKKIKKKTTR